MKLSDLIKLANDEDPEILVYAEDAEYWSVLPTTDGSSPAAVMTKHGMVLCGDMTVDPVQDWTGTEPNPFTGHVGVTIGPVTKT